MYGRGNYCLNFEKMAGEMAGEGDELYCVCRQPYKTDQFMIECDICNEWFHGT